jgi:hypothetical protein
MVATVEDQAPSPFRPIYFRLMVRGRYRPYEQFSNQRRIIYSHQKKLEPWANGSLKLETTCQL